MRIAWSTGTVFLLGSLVAGTWRHAISPAWPAQAAGQTPASTPSQTARAETEAAAQEVETLRQMESNYMRAEMEGSAKLAGTILADDYLGIRGDGTAMDKTKVLHNLASYSHTREPYTITATNMREHVFGDMACVDVYKNLHAAGKRRFL